jgi:carboxylate-amine ligase
MGSGAADTDLAFRAEPLHFRADGDTSLGVEIELQILDRETGELAPGAQRILEACAEEGVEGISGEFHLSMIEVKTGICQNVTEVRDDLTARLARLTPIVRSFAYELSAGGTHPYARPGASAIFPDARYDRMRKRQALLAYQESVFGLHVHVGVPGAAEALALISLLVPYLPHMLALSANSPFWEGQDSGFASSRAVMFRPSGHAGVPPHFASWEEFGRFCRALGDCGLIESTKDLYWDIRPRPLLGTIEFRIFDAPPSLSIALGLAALARCLVIDGLRCLRESPHLRAGDPVNHWIATENKLVGARFGLRGECVRCLGCKRRTLAKDTEALLDRLSPVARAAGEETYLNALRPEQFECGADWQRSLYRQTGSWRAVVDAMRGRWASELPAAPLRSEAIPAHK